MSSTAGSSSTTLVAKIRLLGGWSDTDSHLLDGAGGGPMLCQETNGTHAVDRAGDAPR